MDLLQYFDEMEGSAMLDQCRPPAEKRCDATKANVPRSQSASSADRMASRWTLVSVQRESTKLRRQSSSWDRREALEPPGVDTSTMPCQVSHGANPPPPQHKMGLGRGSSVARYALGRAVGGRI